MNTFVTGSTGLLGTNLIQLLLTQGHQVKALVRNGSKTNEFVRNCQIVNGDITRCSEFSHALAGSDVIFHTAAYFKEYSHQGDHELALRQTNVEATISLLENCRLQGIRNFIYVSSNGVTGLKCKMQNEGSGFNEQTDNLYFKSKIESEKAIDDYIMSHPEMRVIIIRPSLMIGPHDSGPTQAGKVLLSIVKGKMPFILPGNIVVVDARDVAKSMVNAVNNGISGERFIIGGNLYSIAKFAETIHDISGVKLPKHKPPYSVAMIMLSLAYFICKIKKHNLPVRPMDLHRMRILQLPDSSKAKKVLSTQFRDLSESLNDSITWFKQNKYC